MEATLGKALRASQSIAVAFLIALSATLVAPAAAADPPVPPQPSVVETLQDVRDHGLPNETLQAYIDYVMGIDPLASIDVLDIVAQVLALLAELLGGEPCDIVFGGDCPLNFAVITFIPGDWDDYVDLSAFDPYYNQFTIGIMGYGPVDDGQGGANLGTGYYWLGRDF